MTGEGELSRFALFLKQSSLCSLPKNKQLSQEALLKRALQLFQTINYLISVWEQYAMSACFRNAQGYSNNHGKGGTQQQAKLFGKSLACGKEGMTAPWSDKSRVCSHLLSKTESYAQLAAFHASKSTIPAQSMLGQETYWMCCIAHIACTSVYIAVTVVSAALDSCAKHHSG